MTRVKHGNSNVDQSYDMLRHFTRNFLCRIETNNPKEPSIPTTHLNQLRVRRFLRLERSDDGTVVYDSVKKQYIANDGFLGYQNQLEPD